VNKILTYVQTFYKEMNPATLSGSIDILVVRQPDGELISTPFHARFGKLKLLRPKQNKVEIFINGEKAGLYMKVGEAGEAFFVVETEVWNFILLMIIFSILTLLKKNFF